MLGLDLITCDRLRQAHQVEVTIGQSCCKGDGESFKETDSKAEERWCESSLPLSVTLWCATIPVADCSQTLLAGTDAEESNCRMIRGDKVVLHYHAVNHDEDVFGDDALRFDIHRAKRMPSMRREIRSFGIGEHFCLGMNLARMELKVIFEELIPRLRNPEFAGEVRYMRSFFINTIKAMPIRFDPEE